MIYWICCQVGWVVGGLPGLGFSPDPRLARNFSSFAEADAFGKAHIKNSWYVIVQPASQGEVL